MLLAHVAPSVPANFGPAVWPAIANILMSEYRYSFIILICRELLLSQGSLNTLDVQGRNHLDSSRNYSSQPDSSTRPFSSQPDSSTRPFSFQPDSSTRPFTSQPESSNRPFSSQPEASNRPFSSQPEASNRSFSSHSSDPLRTYSSYGPEPNHRTQYSHNSYSQVREKLNTRLNIYLCNLMSLNFDLLNF